MAAARVALRAWIFTRHLALLVAEEARVRTVIVAAAIIIENGRVLLTQRKADTHLAGMWEFPGGKAEAGEDPKAALRRELGEELGIDAEIGDIVDVAFHRYEEADKAVLLLFYEASRSPGSSAPPAASDQTSFSDQSGDWPIVGGILGT
jgi:8-oxo-dGTP diphosphatase